MNRVTTGIPGLDRAIWGDENRTSIPRTIFLYGNCAELVANILRKHYKVVPQSDFRDGIYDGPVCVFGEDAKGSFAQTAEFAANAHSPLFFIEKSISSAEFLVDRNQLRPEGIGYRGAVMLYEADEEYDRSKQLEPEVADPVKPIMETAGNKASNAKKESVVTTGIPDLDRAMWRDGPRTMPHTIFLHGNCAELVANMLKETHEVIAASDFKPNDNGEFVCKVPTCAYGTGMGGAFADHVAEFAAQVFVKPDPVDFSEVSEVQIFINRNQVGPTIGRASDILLRGSRPSARLAESTTSTNGATMDNDKQWSSSEKQGPEQTGPSIGPKRHANPAKQAGKLVSVKISTDSTEVLKRVKEQFFGIGLDNLKHIGIRPPFTEELEVDMSQRGLIEFCIEYTMRSLADTRRRFAGFTKDHVFDTDSLEEQNKAAASKEPQSDTSAKEITLGIPELDEIVWPHGNRVMPRRVIIFGMANAELLLSGTIFRKSCTEDEWQSTGPEPRCLLRYSSDYALGKNADLAIDVVGASEDCVCVRVFVSKVGPASLDFLRLKKEAIRQAIERNTPR